MAKNTPQTAGKGKKPKKTLFQNEAVRAGRGDDFYFFHLGYPEISAQYNPVGSFSRITEVATRIAGQMPAEGQSAAFKEFVWGFVNQVAKGLVGIGQTPNFPLLKQYSQNLDPLYIDFMDMLLSGKMPDYRETLNKYQALMRLDPKERREQGLMDDLSAIKRDRDAIARYLIYKHHEKTLLLTENERDIAQSLTKAFLTDQQYLSKLVASLDPFLEKMTTGAVSQLIAPLYLDPSTGAAESALFTLWMKDTEKLITDALRYLGKEITVQNVMWCNTHFDSLYVEFMDKLMAGVAGYPQAVNADPAISHEEVVQRVRSTDPGYSPSCRARYWAWCKFGEKDRFSEAEFALAEKLGKCLTIERRYLSRLLTAVFAQSPLIDPEYWAEEGVLPDEVREIFGDLLHAADITCREEQIFRTLHDLAANHAARFSALQDCLNSYVNFIHQELSKARESHATVSGQRLETLSRLNEAYRRLIDHYGHARDAAHLDMDPALREAICMARLHMYVNTLDQCRIQQGMIAKNEEHEDELDLKLARLQLLQEQARWLQVRQQVVARQVRGGQPLEYDSDTPPFPIRMTVPETGVSGRQYRVQVLYERLQEDTRNPDPAAGVQ